MGRHGEIVFDPQALAELIGSPDGGVARDLTVRAVKVESRAKRRVPVDTGRLRSSVRHMVGEDREGLFADIGSDVEYAAYVEFSQPWLRPAVWDVTNPGWDGGE